MVPTFTDKLKKYRSHEKESYARTIVAPPKKVPNILAALRFPGVALIMGDIRQGKTGVAHEIARQAHIKYNAPAVLHLPSVPSTARLRIQRMLPKWMRVTSKRSEWPEGAVVIVDEAAREAHARRSQSGQAVELDDLTAIAGQRGQLILFISHFSRKLDLNACTAVHRIIWKRPTYAHKMWERTQMSDFTMKAFDFFAGIRGEVSQKKANLILDMDHFIFMSCNNKLPPWWNDKVSKAFREIEEKGGGIFA